jgi:hypothetical protein
MAYKLNKTDGTLLTELVDGQIDTTSSDLTLIGRNYVGFGEAFNENLIKLLENFASSGAPSSPIKGQIWYDSSEARLKVYDGSAFKSNGPIVQNTQPQMVAGDIWINNSTNKLYFFDGSDLVLVGPVYENAQGLSGWEVDTVRDRSAVDHTLLKMYVGGILVAYVSNDIYTPTLEEQSKLGITTGIRKGISFVDEDNFRIYGVADAANSLITDQIDADTGLRIRKTAGQFLPSGANGTTTGSLFIQNQTGLTVGSSGQTRLFVTAEGTVLQNNAINDTFRYRLLGDTDYDGIVINPSNRGFGINLDAGTLPAANLEVNGDTIIRGDLTVQGSSVTIETTTLTVDDYNIEIGAADTVITLDAALGSSVASQLAVNEIITQGSTNASGFYKSLSTDRTQLILEPRTGTFTASTNTLTGGAVGTLFQEDLVAEVNISSVAQRTDATAGGGGVILKGPPDISNANDKHILWINDIVNGTNWEFSDSINLVNGKAYKIDDVTMIQENVGNTFHELGVAIEEATGLRDVGIMDRLRVHSSMTLDELSGTPTITTTSALEINSAGTITFKNSASNVMLTGAATTQYYTGNTADVANKDYVDTRMESKTISLQLDVTDMPQVGFATLGAQIIDTLTFLYPPYELRLGTYARVLTTSLRGAVSGINVQDAIQVSSIGVDFSDINSVDPYGVVPSSNGSNNQQLVDSIGFTSEVDGNVTIKADDGASPTPSSTRVKRYYKVVDVAGTNTWTTSATGPYGEAPGDSIPPVGWAP